MRKTYRVYFIDARNEGFNQKLLEADSIVDICNYMVSLGHTITKIEEI